MREITGLVEKLETEGEKIIEFFSGLNEAQWQLEVYTEGEKWTIQNVLSHFVTSERGLIKLFESIRLGGPGAADDFSIDRYNTSQQEKTKDLGPEELIAMYKSVRADSIAWISGLKNGDLEIKGRHPFLGETVLHEMIKMLYLHNRLHYRDLKKVLK